MRFRRTIVFVGLLVSITLTGCFDSGLDDDNGPLGNDSTGEIWVRITHPAQWGTVSDTVEISVEAGPVGKIDSIGFFVDGQVLGVDSVSPYSVIVPDQA